MIDHKARERLLQKNRDLNLLNSLSTIVKAPRATDPSVLMLLKSIYFKFTDIVESIKGIRIELPKIYPIKGTVSVDKMPDISVKNFSELNKSFQELGKVLLNIQKVTPKITQELTLNNLPPLKIENMSRLLDSFLSMQKTIENIKITQPLQPQKITIPDKVSIKNEVVIKEWADLIDGIEELKKGFILLLNQDRDGNVIPQKVSITNFPPTMVPQPVTNININGLRGLPLSTQISVLTAPTKLPADNLSNRRSMIIYNNSNQTIYLGGSAVTIAAGFPVLRGQYSPPIDASSTMQIYGIAGAVGGADVRVFEVSSDATGS